MVNEENPEPTASVIVCTELNAPSIVFFTNDPVPLAIPTPPSIGPLINPSAGSSIKSFIPYPIFFKSPTGFPIKFAEPTILNN